MSKRFVAHWGPAIALLCAMHCGPAQAQDQVAGELGAGDAIALEGISIFATLSPIASFDYPGQVGVVDREELETRQASTLADVFADVPGVQVDGGARRSGQVPTIRCIREEDILILIDGARHGRSAAGPQCLSVPNDVGQLTDAVDCNCELRFTKEATITAPRAIWAAGGAQPEEARSGLASPPRFERGTCSLGGCRSILLSYGNDDVPSALLASCGNGKPSEPGAKMRRPA